MGVKGVKQKLFLKAKLLAALNGAHRFERKRALPPPSPLGTVSPSPLSATEWAELERSRSSINQIRSLRSSERPVCGDPSRANSLVLFGIYSHIKTLSATYGGSKTAQIA
jgi:hypothetical protein